MSDMIHGINKNSPFLEQVSIMLTYHCSLTYSNIVIGVKII